MKENPFGDAEITSILVVQDLHISKKFYVDVLGAELFREYSGNSIVLKFLNHWILLVTNGGPTEDKPGVNFTHIIDEKMVNHSFTIRIANCETTYQVLRKRGCQFLTPPKDWGAEIRCFFRDPDGHLFEISEYRAS